MWDSETGVEVRIRPFGSRDPYQEYKAKSTSPLYAGDRNEAFIEAVDNERYVVEVIVHPLFQWKKARHLSIRYKFDGGIISRWVTLEKPKDAERLIDRALTFIDYVGGVHRECGFTFGPVRMVDTSSFLTQDEEDDEISRRGEILVFVQRDRAKKYKWTKKETHERLASEPRETLLLSERTNKKVVGDNGRSHYTRAAMLKVVSHDTALSNTMRIVWTAAKDEAGESMAFTFYYTIREYLERQNFVSMITYPTTRANAINVDEYVPVPAAPETAPERAETQGMRTPAQPSSGEQTHLEGMPSFNKRIKIEDESDETEGEPMASARVSGCNNGFHQGSGCTGDRPDCNVTHDHDHEVPLPRKRISIAAATADLSDRDMYSATPGPSAVRAPSSLRQHLLDSVPSDATESSGMISQDSSDDEEEDDSDDVKTESSRAPADSSSVRSVATCSLTLGARKERRTQIADELREIELRKQLRALEES
ncbi:hypothetical protein LTR85_003773 [Meristemomyces frigidus]|nr:hypothetical protein LTR85_003773 [Meristemomyces frigidus]